MLIQEIQIHNHNSGAVSLNIKGISSDVENVNQAECLVSKFFRVGIGITRMVLKRQNIEVEDMSYTEEIESN